MTKQTPKRSAVSKNEQRFCPVCKKHKHKSDFSASRLHYSINPECRKCRTLQSKERYKVRKHVFSLKKRLTKQLGVPTKVEIKTVREILKLNNIDVEKCTNFEIFPPKDKGQLHQIDKYQVVTY